jgi:hypothetical protein
MEHDETSSLKQRSLTSPLHFLFALNESLTDEISKENFGDGFVLTNLKKEETTS